MNPLVERLRHWSRAHGAPLGGGVMRSDPNDFKVWEISAAQATGKGEHLLLRIRKTQANTEWVAAQLARLAGLPRRAVSFAGQKDRHAVTEQWFSLHLPGLDNPPFQDWRIEGAEILEAVRHERKLRSGALLGNRFEIVLHGLEAEPASLAARLSRVRNAGFPNYFTEQRFGRDGENLDRGRRLLVDRMRMRKGNARSMAISAVRSFLFNEILDARIRTGTWDQILAGEQVQLAGSRSGFLAEEVDLELRERALLGDVHPSAPLWGRGGLTATLCARAAEDRVLVGYAGERTGLERIGLKTERRALRVIPNNLSWQFGAPGTLELRFELPRGAYATALLRELVAYRDAAGINAAAGA